MWILVVDCGCCAGLWLLWLMLVHVHVSQSIRCYFKLACTGDAALIVM